MTPERIAELQDEAVALIAMPRTAIHQGVSEYGRWLHECLDEIERLQALCTEAISELVDWSAYAPDYFKEKWKLDETIASLRERLG